MSDRVRIEQMASAIMEGLTEYANLATDDMKKAVKKGQHEYVLTTHIDKGHVHNHIIFCAVNFVDHRKYVSNKRTYYGIRNMSDKLCRENGLSVVVPGKGSKPDKERTRNPD